MGEQKKAPAKRWGLWFVVVLFLVLTGTGVLGYVQRIELAYWAVEKAAQQLGLKGHRLKIDRLDFTGFELHDVHLGPDVSLKQVKVEYSLVNVLKSRIDKVILSGVAVDVSAPDTGFLGYLQTLLQGNATASETNIILPEIIITDAVIAGKKEDISLNLQLSGKISPDLSGELQVTGKGGYQAFEMQDISLDLSLVKDAEAILFKVKQARFLDRQKDMLLRPFMVTGDGRFQVVAQRAVFSLNISDKDKAVVMDMEGQADLVNRLVQADVKVGDITFSPTGMQPDDLSPLAELPQKLDATLGLSAQLEWQDEAAKLTGDLAVKQARFAIPSEKEPTVVVAGGVGFTVFPLTQSGMLDITKLSLRHQSTPALFHPLYIQSKARLHEDGQLSFEGAVMLDKSTPVRILTGKGDYDVPARRGQMDVRVPVLDFSPAGLKPSDISPLFALLSRVSGKFSAFSRLDVVGEQLSGWADISVAKMSFETDTVQVRDITTDLVIDNIWPLRTKPQQVVTIGEVDSAVKLDHPRLVFTLEGQKFYMHDFQTGIMGGTAHIDETVFETDTDKHDVVLNLKKIELGRLFRLIALDGLSGTGQLSGQLPIRLKGQEINVQDGLLESVGGGTLHFESQKARQALAGAGEQVELLLNVLTNFHYERLSLRINQRAGQNAILNLKIEGKNPEVMNARPFNLNINLEANLDRILGTVLEGYRLSDRAIRATVGNEQ
ncbi:MAG: intermembrane phospholipid transport protein YdbH family protein [Terasakiella sp.]|uniref:intermembrane phospholipid transport protein YdbH family protein n=1 Tax=unclassified Terasakiella TaxID=2614952 RepID=UPI003AFFBF69